jgi:hypothetical protein
LWLSSWAHLCCGTISISNNDGSRNSANRQTIVCENNLIVTHLTSQIQKVKSDKERMIILLIVLANVEYKSAIKSIRLTKEIRKCVLLMDERA